MFICASTWRKGSCGVSEALAEISSVGPFFDSVCVGWRYPQLPIHCFLRWSGLLHRAPISRTVHGNGWCMGREKSTDLPPALLCLIPLLAQPWACLVTFDMQMMRPYWQERTPWQVFTEFECKQNTHTRTHKKKPHLYPYNYIQKAAVLICVLLFFSTLLIVKAQAVPAFAETWTQCPCVQIIQILLCRPPLWLKHNPRACREAGEKGGGGQHRVVKRLAAMLAYSGIYLSLSPTLLVCH